jgi:hypothetical protein
MSDMSRRLTIVICVAVGAGLLAIACVPLLQTPVDMAIFSRNLGVELLVVALLITLLFRAQLGIRWDNPRPEETADLRDTRWTRNVVVIFTVLGFLGLLILSLSSEGAKGWTGASLVFGKLGLYAGGCFCVGALVGFLFGIPRSLQGKSSSNSAPRKDSASGKGAGSASKNSSEESSTSGRPEAEDRAIYATNTNLEEISDWLTKIIVGLGLINLKVIPSKLKSVAWYFAEYGKGPVPESVSLALILYFSTCGFFLAYLMTRLFLTGAFTRADVAAATRREEITASATAAMHEAEASPHAQPGVDVEPLIEQQVTRAQSIASIARSLDKPNFLGELQALAKRYEALRAIMKPGEERTAQLEAIASGIRSYALANYSLLDHFIASPSPGERLITVLFLEVQPDCKYSNWLAERFTEEKPFFQYHAAVALRIANQKLGATCRAQIRAAAQAALKALGEGKEETDRYKVLQQVLVETA